MFQYIFW